MPRCTPRGSFGRAWNSRMICRIASPVRSSMSADDTSSTTATCSLTMRKKSTAPGVHSRPSSASLGALLRSAWPAPALSATCFALPSYIPFQ